MGLITLVVVIILGTSLAELIKQRTNELETKIDNLQTELNSIRREIAEN